MASYEGALSSLCKHFPKPWLAKSMTLNENEMEHSAQKSHWKTQEQISWLEQT